MPTGPTPARPPVTIATLVMAPGVAAGLVRSLEPFADRVRIVAADAEYDVGVFDPDLVGDGMTLSRARPLIALAAPGARRTVSEAMGMGAVAWCGIETPLEDLLAIVVALRDLPRRAVDDNVLDWAPDTALRSV